MSSNNYDRGSSRRRGVLGHWVPLVVTVTVATIGIAAWVWSQRREDEPEDPEPYHQDLDYENADYGDNPPYGASREASGPKPPPSYAGSDLRPGETGYGTTNPAAQVSGTQGAQPEGNGPTWASRMSGALGRTPSPQQFFDSAGKTVAKNVAAGVAAAGAVVGSALAAIREEDKTAYADHETWSEEADAKKERPAGSKSSGKRRKVVAVVVSANTDLNELDDEFHEHASILSHIPRQNDFSAIKLFILIYAPGLKESAFDANPNIPPASLSSSYSNIEKPTDDTKSPLLNASGAGPAFNAVYSQALALVEHEKMIIPFTSPDSHSRILRQLQPEILYLQESLAGETGATITQMQSWLRHDIILVVGAESGHGGLADSESEAEKPGKVQKWWQREDRVGRGRGVIVVDSMRVHDDWARRVQGKE